MGVIQNKSIRQTRLEVWPGVVMIFHLHTLLVEAMNYLEKIRKKSFCKN